MKLNLGCGTKKLPDFINIDIRPEVNPNTVDDICKLTTIENNSADLIYACHVLEHISFTQIRQVLLRWYDILKLDGILRLSVPDIDAVFAHYFYWKDLKLLRGFLWGGQDTEYNYHKSGWDYKTIKEQLEDIGFEDIKKWDWQETSPHDYIDDYSQVYWPSKNCTYQRGEVVTQGKLMSLNMQGIKPSNE